MTLQPDEKLRLYFKIEAAIANAIRSMPLPESLTEEQRHGALMAMAMATCNAQLAVTDVLYTKEGAP